MINIVNKTTYLNSSGLHSGSFNLVNPSSAGNLLVIISYIGFPNNNASPSTFHTDQGETFTRAASGIDGFSSALILYLLTTKTATNILFANVGGAPNAVPTAIVYEVSGNSLSFVAHGANGFGVGVSTYQQVLTVPLAANSIVFYSSISRVSVSSVAPSPTETDALPVPPGAGINDIVSAEIYNNISNDPTPTFTLSSSSVIGAPAAAFTETAVVLTPTTATLISNINPSAFGQAVTFTATVNGPGGVGSPTGTATFNIDGTNVAVVNVTPVSAGVSQAQYSTSALTVGTHLVFGVYSGDASYLASTSNTVNQVVLAPAVSPPSQNDQIPVNPSADVIWWHTGFTGIDSEIAAMEGMISEGGPPNIPWLLGLSVSQGNAMTEAIARSNIIYIEPEWGNEGGGGGNESGAQMFGGAQSGGLSVSW